MAYALKEVVIETTQQCNLRCVHCASACGNKVSVHELTVQEWKNPIAQLARMGVEKIVFSGGELTVKPGVEDLLAYTHAQGVRYGIITNGLLLRHSVLNTLLMKKPFAVGISLDGMKETHNRIRRNNQSWQRAWKTISQLMDAGIQICVVTTVSKLNYKELSVLASFLGLAEVDSWQLQLIMPSGRAREQDDILLNEKIFQEVCRDIFCFRKAYPGMNIEAADCFGLAPKGSIRRSDWGGCGAGISGMGIDAFGNVMPCLSLRTELRCGNVRTQEIKGIWETSSGFDFNRKFNPSSVEGQCAACEFLSMCRGGCSSMSFAYHNHFHDSPFCYTRSFKREGGRV